MNLSFEKLSRKHDRESFDCGEEELNHFLKKYAHQNAKKDLGKTFLLIENGQNILGFYTISNTSLSHHSFPETKRLPRYVIPSALIGRLAIDKQSQGKGYGKLLLVNALERILALSSEIGIHCITVEAKSEDARDFYLRFGFKELVDNRKHLFMSLQTVRKLFN